MDEISFSGSLNSTLDEEATTILALTIGVMFGLESCVFRGYLISYYCLHIVILLSLILSVGDNVLLFA